MDRKAAGRVVESRYLKAKAPATVSTTATAATTTTAENNVVKKRPSIVAAPKISATIKTAADKENIQSNISDASTTGKTNSAAARLEALKSKLALRRGSQAADADVSKLLQHNSNGASSSVSTGSTITARRLSKSTEAPKPQVKARTTRPPTPELPIKAMNELSLAEDTTLSPLVALTRMAQWRYLNARSRRLHAEEEQEAQRQIMQVKKLIEQLREEKLQLELSVKLEGVLVAIEKQYGQEAQTFTQLVNRLQSFSDKHQEISNTLERTLSTVELKGIQPCNIEHLAVQLERLHCILSTPSMTCDLQDRTTAVFENVEQTVKTVLSASIECKNLLASLETLGRLEQTYVFDKVVSSWHEIDAAF